MVQNASKEGSSGFTIARLIGGNGTSTIIYRNPMTYATSCSMHTRRGPFVFQPSGKPFDPHLGQGTPSRASAGDKYSGIQAKIAFWKKRSGFGTPGRSADVGYHGTRGFEAIGASRSRSYEETPLPTKHEQDVSTASSIFTCVQSRNKALPHMRGTAVKTTQSLLLCRLGFLFP